MVYGLMLFLTLTARFYRVKTKENRIEATPQTDTPY
jgi:hypothetical protein